MRRFMIALALALALVAGMVVAETNYQTASVTNTASYLLLTKAAQSVLICNDSASANIAYFRLFEAGDSVAAATTSSSPLAIGACKSFGNTGGKLFTSLSLLSAGTSTINIDSH